MAERQLQMSLPGLNLMNQEFFQKMNEGQHKVSSYKCEKCKDTGWILIPQKNAAPIARSCECREREKLRNQWIAAGINPDDSKQTFTSFVVWNDESRKAKDAAISYFHNFSSIRSSRKNSILFCGQVGSGKTHLSVALALNFINKKIKVVYMPYRNIITKIKQNIMDDETYKKMMQRYQSCEVLLIDDLFKGKTTETDINIFFEILNYRYLNNMPIMVSTEHTVGSLLDFDEAIGSRIYEMCKDYIVEIKKDKENNYRLRQ